MRNETRFRMVEKQDPQRFKRLLAKAERQARQRESVYRELAGMTIASEPAPAVAEPAAAAPSPAPAASK